MANRLRIAARNTAITLATLIAAAFLFVQSQQWILRHRAEQLFKDIQAFQLRQANFADLQKFQQRWGSRAHYDGTCSIAHCSYHVELSNSLDTLVYPNHIETLHWLEIPYHLFTVHEDDIQAVVELHNDKIWGTQFEFFSFDKDTFLHQIISFSPHLFPFALAPSDELRRGYSVDGPANVREDISLRLTPQTSPLDIKRLSALNFNCLTRLKPCLLATDFLPAAAADPLSRRGSREALWPAMQRATFDCDAPVELFAREAEGIVEVQVLDVHPYNSLSELAPQEEARVRVLKQMKNAKSQTLNSEWNATLYDEQKSLQAASSPAVRKFVPGRRYILLFSQLFSHPASGQELGFLGAEPCSAYPMTDSIVSAINKGIAMDLSGGEPSY